MNRSLKTLALASLVLAGTLASGVARADRVYWSVGVNAPGYPVGVGATFSNAPGVYVAPAPVIYAPPPVYVAPPPVVYAPPVYVAPRPVYYGPAPVVYGGYYRGWKHRHHHDDDDD
ncbi:MAG TPA: hypothetical protein VFV25_09150 [Methylibium sp.]